MLLIMDCAVRLAHVAPSSGPPGLGGLTRRRGKPNDFEEASGPSSPALLEALVPRVERFELLESELALNNTLRGLGTLKVRVG